MLLVRDYSTVYNTQQYYVGPVRNDDCMPDTDAKANEEAATMVERQEDHPLVELLGNRSRVKIFMALHDAASPLNPHDITDTAGISRNAWYDNRDVLLKYGVVEETGKYGNSPV